jgi:hypothetical protein
MTIDPRREASERVRERFEVRVLEPSPPARDAAPWFADDPVAAEPRLTELPLLTPVPGGDRTWDELAREEPDLRDWCAERWLGAWRPLTPITDTRAFAATRTSWHALAEQVVAPARRQANGKIGLRYTVGGVGTPFFGDDEQVRITGTDVVVVRGGAEHRVAITTVGDAARAAGVEAGAPADLYTAATSVAPDAHLAVDPGAASLLANWFGFGCSVLETLRVEEGAWDTRTQLWPEHFDLSIDLGDEAAGSRGTFGVSPGDGAHPEPYLYVTHWAPLDADGYWNDDAFGGASLSYAALAASHDARAAALEFFATGLARLRANERGRA